MTQTERQPIPATPGRTLTGLLALAVIAAVIALDALRADPIDPFEVPPPVALGSGQEPGGAHCADG